MTELFVSAKSGVSASSSELESIQERYMTCLRAYTQSTYPEQPNRFQELLVRLPEVSLGFNLRVLAPSSLDYYK